MEEQVFFNESGILITSTRAVFSGQTYVLANITSVKAVWRRPSESASGCCGVIGVVLFFAGFVKWYLFIIGVLVVALAIFLYNQKTYQIVLVTAGGEQRAFESESEELVDCIMNAINTAIIARG